MIRYSGFSRLIEPSMFAGARETVAVLIELGGGNSVFYPAMRAFFPLAYLVFIDMCQCDPAITATLAQDGQAETVCADVLGDSSQWPLRIWHEQADLVFSFGLIEHFFETDTRHAVASHFDLAKPGGLVFLSFPTQPLRYRLVRSVLEMVSLWPFVGERPLTFVEVRSYASLFGMELASVPVWG